MGVHAPPAWMAITPAWMAITLVHGMETTAITILGFIRLLVVSRLAKARTAGEGDSRPAFLPPPLTHPAQTPFAFVGTSCLLTEGRAPYPCVRGITKMTHEHTALHAPGSAGQGIPNPIVRIPPPPPPKPTWLLRVETLGGCPQLVPTKPASLAGLGLITRLAYGGCVLSRPAARLAT